MSNYLPAGFIIGVVFLFEIEIAHVMGWPNCFMTPWRDIQDSVLGYHYFLPAPASHFAGKS